jgi:hypothetical protein
MGGKSWQRTFGCIEHRRKVGTGLYECGAFVCGKLRIDINVEVRILYSAHGRFWVAFGLSH